jgi:HD superfamily phosphodiesterase
LKLESGMHTDAAREVAQRRTAVMRRYLLELQKELNETIEEELAEDIEA